MKPFVMASTERHDLDTPRSTSTYFAGEHVQRAKPNLIQTAEGISDLMIFSCCCVCNAELGHEDLVQLQWTDGETPPQRTGL